MPQTTIQNITAIRKGSVQVLAGTDFLSLVDLGAIRDAKWSALNETQEIIFDNTDSMKKFVNGKKVQIEFNLAEINLTTLSVLDAGLINLTTQAGTPVTGASQVVASGDWAYNGFIELEHQMGDGTANTITSVTLGTNGAIVNATDYFKGFNAQGKYGIFIIDSATVTTEAQTVTIVYNYTPNASKTITFNDEGTKTLKCVRLINTDTYGNEFRIDIEDVTNFSSQEVTFQGDDSDDVATMAIQLQGNIVEIVDEQQTT